MRKFSVGLAFECEEFVYEFVTMNKPLQVCFVHSFSTHQVAEPSDEDPPDIRGRIPKYLSWFGGGFRSLGWRRGKYTL